MNKVEEICKLELSKEDSITMNQCKLSLMSLRYVLLRQKNLMDV